MANKKLVWKEVYSLKMFNDLIGGDGNMEICRNDDTGKLSFVLSGIRGAVGESVDLEDTSNTVVNRVVGDDGEPFWLLTAPKANTTVIKTIKIG